MGFWNGEWIAQPRLGDLVRATQRGEPFALDRLVNAIRPSLVAFFARRISPTTSEDLAQIALIPIVRAIDRIDAERADRYVMTVARNMLRTEQPTLRLDDRPQWSIV